MKKLMMFVVAAMAVLTAAVVAQELRPDDQALRSRIEARFDVVPLSDAIGLRPKVPAGDVRLIEVSDTVSINGEVVSGRDLRERLGADADAVLKLSYLVPAVRRALFAKAADEAAQAPAPTPDETPPANGNRSSGSTRRRSGGDRVRVFGDVSVREGEAVSGQVVAVLGSVRIDGEVGDQVVAVLGSIDLGPHAVVHGDIVSVGGHVRRAAGAEVEGAVTEISPADARWDTRISPWLGGLGLLSIFDGFGAVPRLIGTGFRLLLLLLFASLAMVVARGSVERSAQRVSDNPVKAALVGVAAELLFVPVLVLTCIVLSISIVGIPLLLLMPFVVLLLLVLALVGFADTAMAVGQTARRRFNLGSASGFGDVWLGILIILFPVLVARIVGLGGFLASPLVFLLVAAGLGLEFLAWATGLGAVLTNSFSHWQARRVIRTAVPPPPMPPSPMPPPAMP